MHRIFTQNTDDLHINSGLAEEEVIHAHGHNAGAMCAICGAKDSYREMREAFKIGEVRWCQRCLHEGKKSPIKPSVVFFNESLPKEFYEAA